MSRDSLNELYEQIDLLLSSADSLPIALLCMPSEQEAILPLLDDYQLFLLDSEKEKHHLKRALNQEGCELILFTSEFEPMIDELFNDGTTFLQDSILLDDYL